MVTYGDDDYTDLTIPEPPSYCAPTDTEDGMVEQSLHDASELSPSPWHPRPPASDTNNRPNETKPGIMKYAQ